MRVWIGTMLILTHFATGFVAFARPLPLPPPPTPRAAGAPARVPNRDPVRVRSARPPPLPPPPAPRAAGAPVPVPNRDTVAVTARLLPPPPPTAPRVAGEPAPVPDRDAVAPPASEPTGPTIHPRLLRTPTYQNAFDPSMGYVAGSQIREDQEDVRHPLILSPGFVVSFPIH